MKALPPELWELIVNKLEREDQKTCRLLSKLHHDFTTRALFAHVNVYFGLWMVHTLISQSKENVAELRRKNNATWEILRHISFSPDFAKLVKELNVWAYLPVSPGGRLGEDIFHSRALVEALQALPNLRAFRWHGHSPALSQYVLMALAKASGPSLKELHIPIKATTVHCLSAFSGMQELCSVECFDFGPSHGDNCALQMAVDGMSRTLRRIALVGDAIWRCSIQSMLGLQELEVIFPRTAWDLGLVCRHCVSLRSLTLFTRARDEFLSALQADPTALPDLRALKFIYWSKQETFSGQHAQILANFIENKRDLVSLDIEINGQGDETCDKPLLEAIAYLPHLEVLGFSLARSAWAPGDIKFFREHLPCRLTALRISLSFAKADNDVFLQEWFSLIQDLTSLRYLHIFDSLRTCDLRRRILDDPPTSLELFGYGPFLRWLVHHRGDDPGDDPPKYSPYWPPSKVKFRSVEDFGCAEWEWLLRWYGDFTPGLFNWFNLYRDTLLE